MRRRGLAFSVSAALLFSSPALAMRGGSATITAPGEASLRAEVKAAYRTATPARTRAWSRLLADTRDVRWRALWDEDTGAPLRVYGGFAPAPGAMASEAVAEAHAKAFLASHLDLIAPSVSADDFAMVADHLGAGTRTIVFEQRASVTGVGAVRVPGAIVSLRYKNDRLFVVASEAARRPDFDAPKVKPLVAASAARAWVAKDHAGARVRGTTELVGHRLVHRGGEEVRLAYRVEVLATAPRAAFEVFVDARTGAPISRASLYRFANESVAIDAPVRGPDAERMNYPAVFEAVNVGATPASTDATGNLTWSDPSATTLTTLPSGQFVDVRSQGGDGVVNGSFPLADGGAAVWSLATIEFADAQLSAYVHVNRVREHALTIAPTMPFLTSVIVANPNVADPQGCNAYWDGVALNFFRENGICNNSARVADVVYHEFGHGFHQNSLIAGVGMLDAALGEGTADYMAVSLTGDPNLAPAFFLGQPEAPLRVIDSGRRWPDDISPDPHETGLIWAGSMWDLRKYLSEEMGAASGAALANQLYYGAIQRATSIPSTYVEVLAADDDDGDLGNGTPHFCEIERAFSAHGLAEGLDATGLTIEHVPLDIVHGSAGYKVSVEVKRPHPECKHAANLDAIAATVTINGQTPVEVPLQPAGKDRYAALLPGVPSGSVFGYHLTARAGTTSIVRPENRADPDYYVFAGETETLYCDGFENGKGEFKLDDGGFTSGSFAVGEPGGNGGDPEKAYAGKGVLGTTLGGDGLYLPNKQAFARSPTIDLKGARNVHLQMRRWLTVEDGFYDHASITANDTLVWQNVGTNESDGTLSLVDKEWRFFDVDLSNVVAGTAQVTLGLDADPQGNLGGWNVDEFCIVAVKDSPPASTSSSGTGAGGASSGDSDPGSNGCGCEAAGTRTAGGLPLLALGLLLFGRRRRRLVLTA